MASRDMFDDSATAEPAEEDEDELDDSVKDEDFDPTKESEDAESGDKILVVDADDAVLSQVRKANAKL